MRLFFSAGEASGDLYASKLLHEIQLAIPEQNLTAEGIGGKRLQSAGATVHADTSRWGAIGITESFKLIPRVFTAYYSAKRKLSSGTPGLFIPIDFGYVNIRLARHAKNRGWKVLYFIPPGSWRRDRQGGDLPAVTDWIVTPFPWSAEILSRMGANAHWFGHPLKQVVGERHHEGSDRIAVLPGSRHHEIELNLPAIAKALEQISGTRTVEFAVASSVSPDEVRSRWTALGGGNATFTAGDTAGVLNRAKAAIVCSGTATLEAALCETPCVVVYNVSRVAEVEAKIVRFKVEYIALPNIILQRRLLPELIQHDASPENIAKELAPLLQDGQERESQLAGFREIVDLLGPSDAITKTASLVRQIVLADQKDIPS